MDQSNSHYFLWEKNYFHSYSLLEWIIYKKHGSTVCTLRNRQTYYRKVCGKCVGVVEQHHWKKSTWINNLLAYDLIDSVAQHLSFHLSFCFPMVTSPSPPSHKNNSPQPIQNASTIDNLGKTPNIIKNH